MKNKYIYISVGVLVILVILFIWLWQRNTYSKETLKLEIIAPNSVDMGKEIEYLVKFKNNGDVRLEEPSLVFEFPPHSVPSEGEYLRKTITEEDMGGAIYPGEEKIFKFKGSLFGQAGETREAKAMLTYRPKNLTAKYVSKTSHLATINNVPLSFEFDLPSYISSGQTAEFSINYFSSIDFPLTDVVIKTNYPSEFNFTESEPRGLANNEWQIALLNKAEGGRIVIRGILNGETGQDKLFKAELGIWVSGTYVVLKEISKRVEIIEPSIYIDQTINGSRDYVAKPGDLLHYEIIFRNIGDNPFQDLFLVTKLRGDLLDFSTLKKENGEYGPGDNSIIWDGREVSSLKFLEPGSEGMVEFWINVREDAVPDLENPQIENEVRLAQTKKKFSFKISSNVELVQKGYVDDEIFGSQGPLPLKVNQESFFTMIWQIKNYYNSLKDVKVSAVLPSEVRLTGEVIPQKLTFDSATRKISWEIGELPAKAGLEEPFQIAFQISLTPGSEDKGKTIDLIKEVKILALDEWSEESIDIEVPALTSEVFGEEGVVQ